MKKYIIMWMSVALFISCSENNDNDAIVKQSISIDAEVIEFDGTGNALTSTNAVTVTSSSTWRIVGDTSWCTPSVEKGSDGDKVSFTVSTTDSETVRSVNFVFICGDAATKLSVRQVPEPTVEFIKIEEPYVIDAAGGWITIKLKTNLEQLNYEISEDWITLRDYPENSTSIEKWAQFEINANKIFEGRRATITLFKGTPVETIITIEQNAFTGILIQSDELLEFGVDGGTATVKAVADAEFTASIPWGSEWISVEELSSEGTDIIAKTFKVICQPSEYPRTGKVNFYTVSGASAYVGVEQTNPEPELFDVPDAIFADYLVSLGYVERKDDKYYLTYPGYTATAFQFYNIDEDLASVEGIGKFFHLTSLSLYRVKVRKIDLSANVNLTNFTTNYVPLEEVILGDLELTNFTIKNLITLYNTQNSPKSFKLSGSKVTKLVFDPGSFSLVESIDITACPKLETLSSPRSNGLLKTIYVTQAQKDAYDSGKLIITTNPTYPVSIVPK